MSKEYFCFEEEDGKTAFLCGVIDVLSDDLEMYLDFGSALDADVFYIKNNATGLLDDAVKKRLNKYNECNLTEQQDRLKIKIDAVKFELEKIEGNAEQYFCETLSKASKNSDIFKAANKFLRAVNWYLGEPAGLYRPVNMPDKNIGVLGEIYLYTAWNYFFIRYEEYMLLVILGTVE